MTKKIIAMVAVIIIMVSTACQCFAMNALYKMPTIVIEVNTKSNIVTCLDSHDHLWQFRDCEDWQEGDLALLTMYTRYTQKLYDDEIVAAKNCGLVK